MKEVSDEEKQVTEPVADANVNPEPAGAPVESTQPFEEEKEEQKAHSIQLSLEETAVEKPVIANDILPEPHVEGDDGWQPVQRPRSAGLYGRRIRQRRTAITTVYNYQKKDVVSESNQTGLRNTYLLKKRMISPGSYIDYHTAKSPSQGPKFGRRIVKALTYRVKSTPSSAKDPMVEIARNGGEEVGSLLEGGLISAPKEVGMISQKCSFVSLDKSPSYKEVALAPPGTISMFQVRVPQVDVSDNKELGSDKLEEETKEEKENAQENIKEEKIQNLAVDSSDLSKDDFEAVGMKEETRSNNETEVNQVPDESVQFDEKPSSIDSLKVKLCEKESSNDFEPVQVEEDLKDKDPVSCSTDAREFPNKKLSASAAPFNPSPTAARAGPPMNITVPTIAPWPLNMGLHPGSATVLPTVNPMCSSPHHLYPSPPPTPNMIHSLRFIYPPYTQPQSLPATTFHPNHYTWPCNVSPNAPEYIHGPIWSHQLDFSVSAPVVEPIMDPVSEPKEPSDISEGLGSPPNLMVDVNNWDEAKKEVNLQLPMEAIRNENEKAAIPSENVKENGDSDSLKTYSNGLNGNKIDNEKTFNILIRGRRNRKQTLRMPISLLKRPYNSPSFKVMYSRVIKGNEAPNSTSFASDENSSVSAT